MAGSASFNSQGLHINDEANLLSLSITPHYARFDTSEGAIRITSAGIDLNDYLSGKEVTINHEGIFIKHGEEGYSSLEAKNEGWYVPGVLYTDNFIINAGSDASTEISGFTISISDHNNGSNVLISS